MTPAQGVAKAEIELCLRCCSLEDDAAISVSLAGGSVGARVAIRASADRHADVHVDADRPHGESGGSGCGGSSAGTPSTTRSVQRAVSFSAQQSQTTLPKSDDLGEDRSQLH